MIIVPEKRIAQPQLAVPLNTGVGDYHVVFNAALYRAYISKTTTFTSLNRRLSQAGIGRTTNSTFGRIEFEPYKSLSTRGATIIYQCYFTSVGQVWNLQDNYGPVYGEFIYCNYGQAGFSSGNVNVTLYGESGSTRANYTTSSPLKSGAINTVIVRFNPSITEIWVNGANVSTTTSGTFTTPTEESVSTVMTCRNPSAGGVFALFYARQYGWLANPQDSADPSWVWRYFFQPQRVAVPTYYPILSNLQATRGNTSASLRTNITY